MQILKDYEELGGDATGISLEDVIREDYRIAQNEFKGFGAYFYRVCYTANQKGPSLSIAQHQPEWRAELDRARRVKGLDAIVWPAPIFIPRPNLPLVQLARIRGAMWTQRLNLPMGPRPGQDSNICAMDYYEWHGADDRKRMIEKTLSGGYTHAVTGPFYDPGGYHGWWPTQTTLDQRTWDWYLDAMEEWKNAGITPVHFQKPDNWTLQQVRDRLEVFYRQDRAKALLPILVPAGWEPWRYEASTRTWGAFADWAADINPEALILAHSVEDVDALKGTDALYNDAPESNGKSWQYVAPKFHGWLIQLGGYVHIPYNVSDRKQRIAIWRVNLAAYFKDMDHRFRHGYADWPTGSRFGPNVPLKFYYGVGGSFAFFSMPDVTEAEVAEFGDIAVASGGDGYLDGGTVAVP